MPEVDAVLSEIAAEMTVRTDRGDTIKADVVILATDYGTSHGSAKECFRRLAPLRPSSSSTRNL